MADETANEMVTEKEVRVADEPTNEMVMEEEVRSAAEPPAEAKASNGLPVADEASPMEEERTFTCFGKLPAEIRLKIWKENIPSHRIHELSTKLGKSASGEEILVVSSQQPLPANLHVCVESRTEFLKMEHSLFEEYPKVPLYHPLFEARFVTNFFVDYDTDIIYLNGVDGHHMATIEPALFKAKRVATSTCGLDIAGDWEFLAEPLYRWMLQGAKMEEHILVDEKGLGVKPLSKTGDGLKFKMNENDDGPVKYLEIELAYEWNDREDDRETNGPSFFGLSPSLVDPIYLTGTFKAMKPLRVFSGTVIRKVPGSPVATNK